MILDLIHTNDLHDHFPQKTLDAIRCNESLLFDSGDAIGGSNILYRDQEPILDRMSAAGYRAMAMGNREFHYRRSVLRKRLQGTKFSILAANLFDLKKEITVQPFLFFTLKRASQIGNEVSNLRASEETDFASAKSGTAQEMKFAVFGLTVPQYPIYSRWERWTGWRFLDPIDQVKHLVPQLRERGAAFVICLSHLGFNRDRILAQKHDGIDLILGGHSHTILTKPYKINNTVILHGGAYGRFVGHWRLSIQSEKNWSVEGDLVPRRD